MVVAVRKRLPRVSAGAPVSASGWANPLVDRVNRLPVHGPRAIDPGLESGEHAGGMVFERMALVTEGTDLLVCTDSGGSVVFVAKPPLLRGNIATRTESGEAQEIHPAYAAGQDIYAVRGIGGGTGIADVEWLEFVPGARAWAKSN